MGITVWCLGQLDGIREDAMLSSLSVRDNAEQNLLHNGNKMKFVDTPEVHLHDIEVLHSLDKSLLCKDNKNIHQERGLYQDS